MKPGSPESHIFLWNSVDTALNCYIFWILSGSWRVKNPVFKNNLVLIIFLIIILQIYYNTIPAFSKFGPQTSFIISTRKRKTNSNYCRFFAAEQLFYLFWLVIHFCQNYIKRKLEYIFSSDTDEYKKYYFHRYYCNLALFLIKINRINTDCAKLDKKILKTEAKIFRLRCQHKLLLRCLRELGDREARNIEDIQKTEKEAESRRSVDPDLSISDNLSFTASETDRALATVSKK